MVEYWLNKNGTLQKSQTINITVDADSAYATVCWVGVIRNTDGCIGDDAQNYCESIYIGVNTSCSDDKQTSGTTSWHDCRITYKIIQSKRTDCEDCGSNTSTCELIDAYVSPYYISTDITATTVYYQYWKTTKNECEVISRVIENDSQKVNIDPSGVACDSDDRTISVPSINYCGGTIRGLSCYVQKPDNCCEQGEVTECYEINDIYYNPQKVDYSGGSVSFYFDYKKITYKDCKKIETFGRFQDSVQVPRCDGNDCCREKTIGIDYVWNGHTLCNGKNKIKLEIKQKKDPNYIGECKCKVEPDTGYCVNTHSVKRYYKNSSGVWTEINNPYVFPYYGGTMKVTWGYSAITVNDDCTSAVTSGNVWEDYIDILPYDGDECDDGTPENTSVIYTFKKSPCSFETDAKDILPSYICNGNNCTNEFTIKYQQYKKPCSDICESCLTKFDIELDSGGTVTSSDTATCDILLVDESKPQWLTVSVNGKNVSYSAPLNSGSTREGGVTFKLNNEECYDTVIVRQIGLGENEGDYPHDPTIECDCDNAFFEAYSAQTALSKNGGEHEFIGSYIFNSCITNVNVSSDCSISYDKEPTCSGGSITFTLNKGGGSFVSNVSFEDGAIYADIEKNNTSEERTYELPISYTIENCGDGEASIMVKQKKGNDPGPGPEPTPLITIGHINIYTSLPWTINVITVVAYLFYKSSPESENEERLYTVDEVTETALDNGGDNITIDNIYNTTFYASTNFNNMASETCLCDPDPHNESVIDFVAKRNNSDVQKRYFIKGNAGTGKSVIFNGEKYTEFNDTTKIYYSFYFQSKKLRNDCLCVQNHGTNSEYEVPDSSIHDESLVNSGYFTKSNGTYTSKKPISVLSSVGLAISFTPNNI